MATANEIMSAFKARHAAPKQKRKSAKQQVAEAKANLLDEILAEMRDKKRSIPKEWGAGIHGGDDGSGDEAMKTIHLQYQPSNGMYLDNNTRTMYSKAVVMAMVRRG